MRARTCATGSHAFTLVELLVVVAIVSILAALMLPSLQRVRKQAKRAKCVGNIHALGIATALYANDNNGYLPSRQDALGRWAVGGWLCMSAGSPTNLGQLYPYMKGGAEAFFCPDVRRSTSSAYVPNTIRLESPQASATFFQNAWVNENTMNTTASLWSGYTFSNHMQTSVAAPGVVEVTNPDSPPYPSGATLYRQCGSKLEWNSPPYSTRWYPIIACVQAWTYEKCGAHEGVGSNILFCDGRVVWLQHNFKVANEDTVNYWNYGTTSGYLPSAWQEVLSLYNR